MQYRLVHDIARQRAVAEVNFDRGAASAAGRREAHDARMIDFGITPDEARDCLFQEPASTRH